MKPLENESKEFIRQLEQLHNKGEHKEIVEKLQHIESIKESYTLTSLLARALNNLSLYEEALKLLENISEQGQKDKKWHFRMGYSLYYIDGREVESIAYLERAIELGDDYPSTYELLLEAKSFMEDEPEDAIEFNFTPKAFAQLSLNMRLQPKHRAQIEDALDFMLRSKKLGCISGGGTQISKEGEPEACDIEIDLVEYSEKMKNDMFTISKKIEVARGSKIKYYSANKEENESDFDVTYPTGNLVGLAIYINKIDLPDEDSEEEGIGEIYSGLIDSLANNGALIPSYGENTNEISLYFYGEGKYELMLEKANSFLKKHPLGKKHRAMQIA